MGKSFRSLAQIDFLPRQLIQKILTTDKQQMDTDFFVGRAASARRSFKTPRGRANGVTPPYRNFLSVV